MWLVISLITYFFFRYCFQVRLLVEAGCNVDAKDLFGNTALHKSSAIGDSHLEVTRFILSLTRELCPLIPHKSLPPPSSFFALSSPPFSPSLLSALNL